MAILTRRTVMAGAAAATGAAASLWRATFAHAGVPQAGKQAASFYRYKVGDIEVTASATASTVCR